MAATPACPLCREPLDHAFPGRTAHGIPTMLMDCPNWCRELHPDEWQQAARERLTSEIIRWMVSRRGNLSD